MFVLGSLIFLCRSVSTQVTHSGEGKTFAFFTKYPPSNFTVHEKRVIPYEYYFSDFRHQMILKTILSPYHIHQRKNSNIKMENKSKERT